MVDLPFTSSLRGRRICLVTSGHVATNPRIVKEADALAMAGADVTVISAPFTELYKPLDEQLSKSKYAWRLVSTDVTPSAGFMSYYSRALIQKTYAALPPSSWNLPGVAESAFARVTAVLGTALRIRPPADLYIAHNLAALPAAAATAARVGAKLGFDLEDCHWGEFPDDDNSRRRRLTRLIEDRYLPQCVHLTAASPLIASHYQTRLGRKITSVLNVFPLSGRPVTMKYGPLPMSNRPASFYWFSQTLGPGRGLEWVIAGLKRIQMPVSLTLRGHPVLGYPQHLLELARGSPLAGRIRFEPVVSPAEIVNRCAEHDIGLSVEDGATLNHRLCLGNKIFQYLLAGLPTLLSDTPAQSAMAHDLGASVAMARLNDVESIEVALRPWLTQPEMLVHARLAAWRLAHERFNWEVEQGLFLNALRENMRWT